MTFDQLDATEVGRAQELMHQHTYVATPHQQQQLNDFAIYAQLDHIELTKQLGAYGMSASNDLIAKVAPLPNVTVAAAQRFYDAHPALFARSVPRIHVREIVVNHESDAQEVLAQLHRGVPFTQLARQYSVDPQLYRDQGGDIGWVSAGRMPGEWDVNAFALSPGQISPIFPLGSMFALVQLVDGPSYDLIPFADLSPSGSVLIAQYLQQQRFLEWLSARILQEPYDIRDPSVTQRLRHALDELRAHPDQGILNGPSI